MTALQTRRSRYWKRRRVAIHAFVAVSLSRNFGHQAALTAALDNVTSDAAVVMDGDLQDLPQVIPQFVERYNQGYDVVCLCEASPPKGTVASAPLLFCLLQVASWASACLWTPEISV